MELGTNIGYIIGLICAIWVIYDVLIVQKGMKMLSKIIWVVCAILFSVITAILYFFLVKRK